MKRAEAGIGAGVGIAVIALATALVYLVKRNALSKNKSEESTSGDGGDTSELPQGRHYEKAEAPAISEPKELDGEVVPIVVRPITRKPVPGTDVQREDETREDKQRHELQ